MLDAQALARLHDLDPGGRAGLVKRVLATYTQSLRRLLDELRAACAAGDREAMHHAAHTLKSSSASVGALDLSALCADVESRLVRMVDDEAGLATQVERLLAEGQRIHEGLAAR
jgi:HPt (histidine-containing phosphotransfer) domain-containing protein